MTFLVGLLPLMVLCNEVLQNFIWELYCIFFCIVPVSTDYVPNMAACVDRPKYFVDSSFRRDITMSSPFDIGSI